MALKMLTKTVVEPPVAVQEPPQIVVPPVVTEALPSNVEAITAEYIELYRKYEYFEVKAMLKRMEEIRKALHAVANAQKPWDKPAIFACVGGELEFSERKKENVVVEPLALIAVLLEKFGPEATATVVDIALTPLRKLLSEYELQQYLTEQPGSRILKSVRPVR